MASIPVIVVHGGSGTIRDELHGAARAGVLDAARAGQRVLLDGGTCVDAVVAAVRVMEDDPAFNAGRGACMNREGEFEMDAGIMRSRDRKSGAIAAAKNLRDAVVVARALMEHGDHHVLAGEGAVRFAESLGVGCFGRDEVWTQKAQDRYDEARAGGRSTGQADTVGAVALDASGDLCAGGSTGGTLLKLPGRVGDTPLIGSGFYADPARGAACATGLGEAILTRVACHELLMRIAAGETPQSAAQGLCDEVAGGGKATMGLIGVLPDGRTLIAHTSTHMSWAMASGDGAVVGDLHRDPSAKLPT